MIQNKIILLTGAAGLIGSKITQHILKNNGKVICGDIDIKKGKLLLDNINKHNACFIPLDITKKDSIADCIEKGYEYFGKIDAAIHCAYPRSKQFGSPFMELQEEALKTDLFNHLGGSILFSQQIINHFLKQGYGNLIHFSSILGVAPPKFEHYEGTGMVSPIEYSAIKSGIIAIVKYLAKYYKKQNIRINAISPGGILDNQPKSFLKKYSESCNSKGMLNPEDLLGTIDFLISDHSQYITGQNIIVDDGWSL